MSALAVFALAFVALMATSCGSTPVPSPIPEAEQFVDEGQLLYARGQTQDAIERFRFALTSAQAEDNLFTQVVCYINLAQCHWQLADDATATSMLAQAGYLLGLLDTEQPNVRRQDLRMLQGKYHEIRYASYREAGEYTLAREQLQLARVAYEQAKD